MRECRSEQKNTGRRNAGDGQMVETANLLAAIQEVLKKLAPDTVFP